MEPYYNEGQITLYLADCRAALPLFAPRSVDAVVTDPPYELGFMGRQWDRSGIANDPAVWTPLRHLLRPGGHLLAFGGTRTYHRMACAIEDAGFEIRDSLAWLYGQGFPKSLDVSKALDKMTGAQRQVVGSKLGLPGYSLMQGPNGNVYGYHTGRDSVTECTISAPATDLARQWDGWGTALKPGHEPIVLARAPLSEPTVAANVARWGTGALNVDGCRLGWDAKGLAGDTKRRQTAGPDITGGRYGKAAGARPGQYHGEQRSPPGRWPANVVLSHTLFCEPVGMRRVRGAGWRNTDLGGKSRGGLLNNIVNRREPRNDHYADPDGTETVEDWACAPDCPVAALDTQSGKRPSGARRSGDYRTDRESWRFAGGTNEPSTGGASRFFYCAKASPSERNAGLAERNSHPTVKPLALMRWLLTLVTPPGGMVLDPFAGSGSTLLAARALGITAVGIEQDEQSCEIAAKRLQQQILPLDLGA